MSKKNEEIAIKPGIVKGFYGVIKSETIDETAKTVWVKVSDSSLDRDNEAILTDGWDFKNYMKNPIFIACHDACELISIIGKTINIEIRPDGLYHQFQYFVGQGNETADWAWTLVKNGIASFSVRFYPHSVLYPGDDVFNQVFQKFSETWGGKVPRAIFDKNIELLEVSQVVIPANPNAVLEARKSSDKFISDVAKQIQEKNLLDKSPTVISGEDPATTPNHTSPPSCDGKLPADLSAALKSLTTDDLSFIQDLFRKVIREEMKPLLEMFNSDNGDISDTFPYTPASPDDNGKAVQQEKYKCDLNQIKNVIEKQADELNQAIAGMFPKHKKN